MGTNSSLSQLQLKAVHNFWCAHAVFAADPWSNSGVAFPRDVLLYIGRRGKRCRKQLMIDR